MIIETLSLKEGAGREIRRLHDKVQHHLRTLKSMGKGPPGPFIMSVLELKLNTVAETLSRYDGSYLLQRSVRVFEHACSSA